MTPQVESLQRAPLLPEAAPATSPPPCGTANASAQCQPPEHCRGAPDCPHHLCHGHPSHDSHGELNPFLRARFWQTYLGVLLILIGVGVLWWIR